MKDAVKLTESQLADLLRLCPPANTHWRHYRTGGMYVVLGAAIHEATLLPLVLYQRHGSPVTFARPLVEWQEDIEHDGGFVKRFVPTVTYG